MSIYAKIGYAPLIALQRGGARKRERLARTNRERGCDRVIQTDIHMELVPELQDTLAGTAQTGLHRPK